MDDAPFSSLSRGERYVFVTGLVDAVTGVFHEIAPDGLLVIGTDNGTVYVNPARVLYARAARV